MPGMSVSHSLGTFAFPGCKFLISKLVCCLPNFVLEKYSQDYQPAIVHSSESCQKLPGWPRSEEKGFTQGLKGDDLCASKHKDVSVATGGRLKAALQFHLYCSSHCGIPCELLSALPCRATSSQGQPNKPPPNLILSLSLQTKTELPPPDCQKLNSSQVHVLTQSTWHTWCIQHGWQIGSVEPFAYTGRCSSLCTQWSHQWNTQTWQDTFRSTDSPKQPSKAFKNIPLRSQNSSSLPHPSCERG